MQDREPPWKDILTRAYSMSTGPPSKHCIVFYTHKLAYTPGTRAASTERGRGTRNRSGFHSYASSPHTALFVLHAPRLRTATVPLGTATSVMSAPSVPRMGSWSGRTVSSVALGAMNAYKHTTDKDTRWGGGGGEATADARGD